MKRSPKLYFRLISNVTIAINLVVGVGAVFLVDRIVPAIDDILQENAYSIQASMSMQVALNERNELEYWEFFKNAKSNITITGENEIVDDIETLSKRYWSGDPDVKTNLVQKIGTLSSVNLKSMEQKDKQAGILGVAGAWALGFLVVISVALQLIARSRVILRLMDPISELISVLEDYQKGNRLRRFSGTDSTDEVKRGGLLLNKLLDRDLHRQ